MTKKARANTKARPYTIMNFDFITEGFYLFILWAKAFHPYTGHPYRLPSLFGEGPGVRWKKARANTPVRPYNE